MRLETEVNNEKMPGLGEGKTPFNRDKEHSKTIAKRKVLERDKEQKLT